MVMCFRLLDGIRGWFLVSWLSEGLNLYNPYHCAWSRFASLRVLSFFAKTSWQKCVTMGNVGAQIGTGIRVLLQHEVLWGPGSRWGVGGGGAIFVRVYESGWQPLLHEDFLWDPQTEIPWGTGQVCVFHTLRNVASSHNLYCVLLLKVIGGVSAF